MINPSIENFGKFRDGLRSTTERSNGDESFIARVIYKSAFRSGSETLNVTLRLTTFEYGQISIDEGSILIADDYHLDFSSDFQNYELLDGNILSIKGSSGKMGDYEAQLIEEFSH